MSCTIQIGSTTSKENYLNKNISLGGSISCEVYGDINVENPTFLVQKSAIGVNNNYLYCPSFGRYYHIASINEMPGERVAVTCVVDVLQTYQSQIKKLNAYVVREEAANFSNLMDTNLPTTVNDEVVVMNFPNSINRATGTSDRNYLLITAD